MIRTELVVAIAGGVVLALPYLLCASRRRNSRRVFGIGLVVAAVVYAVLAAVAGNLRHLQIELGGIAIFSTLALLGIRYSVYFLAVGWAAHVGWDLLLHPVNVSSHAPWWYPALCVGFDLLVAGAILGGAARGSAHEARTHPK